MTAFVLASAFDEIWLQPGGELGMLGVGIETTFVRGALDKLGIEPQIEQRHEFKNAANSIMRTEFTEAHRTALDRLAESLFTDAIDMIAEGRGMRPETVRGLIDTGPRTAPKAQEVGLVDSLGYRDQAYAAMRSRVGPDPSCCSPIGGRRRAARTFPRAARGTSRSSRCSGAIVSGARPAARWGGRSGSDSVGAALRAAASDGNTRAVVLHVDSPGGPRWPRTRSGARSARCARRASP